MNGLALSGGFVDGPIQSAQAFRQIMTAMARPGEILDVSGAAPPAPLSIAAGTILLTLCDPETPLFLAPGFDIDPVRDWITFHTGAPFVSAGDAQFAVGVWKDLPIASFPIGTAEYPDRSTTLIVEVEDLCTQGFVLRGPGIKNSRTLSLPETEVFATNAQLFPLGLDFYFTHRSRLAALPRTTKVS
ncbi:phosphonate C-P lyase system protein PhnH [uncultured Roseobacter sp.]|uniref:phosphonate C-P lyase system protein PhnH n=1 Tax=uncultured Roseobacter sp. TaxID=114847 RepID=UPI002626B77F|nr:phosphonate C-P lyase system protein PhnH [uncultured Roseobacter sp.]